MVIAVDDDIGTAHDMHQLLRRRSGKYFHIRGQLFQNAQLWGVGAGKNKDSHEITIVA
jgi:hypothetical protein